VADADGPVVSPRAASPVASYFGNFRDRYLADALGRLRVSTIVAYRRFDAHGKRTSEGGRHRRVSAPTLAWARARRGGCGDADLAERLPALAALAARPRPSAYPYFKRFSR